MAMPRLWWWVSLWTNTYNGCVKGKESTIAMWKSLEDAFAKKSAGRQTLFSKQNARLPLKAGESVRGHLLRIEDLVRQLRMTGSKLEESDVCLALMLVGIRQYSSHAPLFLYSTAFEAPSSFTFLNGFQGATLFSISRRPSRRVLVFLSTTVSEALLPFPFLDGLRGAFPLSKHFHFWFY